MITELLTHNLMLSHWLLECQAQTALIRSSLHTAFLAKMANMRERKGTPVLYNEFVYSDRCLSSGCIMVEMQKKKFIWKLMQQTRNTQDLELNFFTLFTIAHECYNDLINLE